MPNWLIATILATIFFGIYPIFGNKAGQIHGEKINFIVDTVGMLLICVYIIIKFPNDFYRVTKISLVYSVGLWFSVVAFMLMLYAWRVAPEKLSEIMITLAFSTVITAIINNFIGTKLAWHQWLGAIGAFISIIVLNLDKVTVNKIFAYIK